jgi:hypothetical protein
LFTAYGVPVTAAQREDMALLLARSVRNARERNYAVTQAYIASQLFGLDIPDLPGLPLDAVMRALESATVNLTVLEEMVTDKNRHHPRIVDVGTRAATGQLSRQAQEPARQTVQTVAEQTDGIGWARMLTGATSCSFCAMLASRGPIYKSRESAIGRGGQPMTLYHTAHLNKNGKLVGGDCDCIAVLVVDHNTWEGRPAFEKLEDLWQKTTSRRSNADARNAFRREWDRKVRSGETRDYLAASVTPPGGA